MKKLFFMCVLSVVLIFSGTSTAQYAHASVGYMGSNGGVMMGGLGVSAISNADGTTDYFYNINLRPEVGFGKFGIGLNINLLFNMESGEIRSTDWDEGYDYLRMIRYMRYGHKWDPVYTRIGTLDAARLGHGFIMNYYTNEASYDNRKIGMVLDIDFGTFGFESVASNMGRMEVLGGRVFYRPLVNVIDIPIIKNFALGATMVKDFDPDASDATDDGVTVAGFDAELPLIKSRFFTSMVYYDFATISGYNAIDDKDKTYGSGQAVGVTADFGNMLGLLTLSGKLERRFMGKEFIPAFFDAFYEINRFQLNDAEMPMYKTDMLLAMQEETKGIFGELHGGLLNNAVRLIGMYASLDDVENSGVLHLAADAPDAVPTIAAHATYDKIGIGSGKDVFTLDETSVARVGLGYKIKPYLILYMDYIWNFVETEPGSKKYETQERVEPRLVFSYNF